MTEELELPSIGHLERYDLDYIKRESELLLYYWGCKKKRPFSFCISCDKKRDSRIAKRYGLVLE